ncbi:alginate O-acetyltransferase AlgX-related protein [Butyrivibrio sp. AD3002]|uniref:alginate O-acetyltransferase AlgX-related protein n=1 Tax=Butyrivibrio sp. AD3002 TaxID=1280670 RepID=UPI0003B48033|nr:hypothetical protein [Butyrivibrio sp. AD3002]
MKVRLEMKRGRLFVALFIMILLFSLYGRITDRFVKLNGVTGTSSFSGGTISEILNGETQTNLNTYIENNFGGRSLLIKLRSQLLYSGFGISPNKNVVIGSNRFLFEPEYIYKELNIYQPAGDEYFDELMDKLEEIQNICEENGKELFVFVTPSKAYFCKDMIPRKYFELGNDEETNYQKFIRHIQERNLKYFDSHAYIEEHKNEIEAPVFYSTGIHWSHPWGNKCAIEFAKYISLNSRYCLGNFSQEISRKETKKPDHPDADLYNSLNLFAKPNNDIYYDSRITLESESDCPKVFLRGGSFMGQSLRAIGNAGAWDTAAHFENNYCFVDNYSKTMNFSAFDSYEEFESMGEYLGQADILILEVNEAATPNMSWGFIDYLLDNQQLLKNRTS